MIVFGAGPPLWDFLRHLGLPIVRKGLFLLLVRHVKKKFLSVWLPRHGNHVTVQEILQSFVHKFFWIGERFAPAKINQWDAPPNILAHHAILDGTLPKRPVHLEG